MGFDFGLRAFRPTDDSINYSTVKWDLSSDKSKSPGEKKQPDWLVRYCKSELLKVAGRNKLVMTG